MKYKRDYSKSSLSSIAQRKSKGLQNFYLGSNPSANILNCTTAFFKKQQISMKKTETTHSCTPAFCLFMLQQPLLNFFIIADYYPPSFSIC